MTDLNQIADHAEARVAFSLLRDAYMDLAQTLLRIEEEPARELLRGVEQRTSLRLVTADGETASEGPGSGTFAKAAEPVCAVLRAAQAAA